MAEAKFAMKEYIAPAIQLAILGGFCLGLYRIANGNLKKKMDKSECHQAQEGIKQRIDDLSQHIDTRIDDLKDYIKKNGK